MLLQNQHGAQRKGMKTLSGPGISIRKSAFKVYFYLNKSLLFDLKDNEIKQEGKKNQLVCGNLTKRFS